MTAPLRAGSPEARAVLGIMRGDFAVTVEADYPLEAAVLAVRHLIEERPTLDVVFAADSRGEHLRLANELDRHLYGTDITVFRGARSAPNNIQVRYRFNSSYMTATLLVLVEGHISEAAVAGVTGTFQALIVRHQGSTWLDDPPLYLAGPRDSWGDIPVATILAGDHP